MEEISVSNIGNLWEQLLTMARTTGVEFLGNAALAIAIFVIGKIIARIVAHRKSIRYS